MDEKRIMVVEDEGITAIRSDTLSSLLTNMNYVTIEIALYKDTIERQLKKQLE